MSFIKYLLWGLLIVLAASEISNVPCLLVEPIPDPTPVEDLHGSGTIVFIPTDDFPISTLETLSAFFFNSYGLEIIIGSRLTLPPMTYDLNREQFIAEKILDEVKKNYSWIPSEKPFIPIAFTKSDMYIEKYNWRYAFGFGRDWRVIVSTARMDYGFLNIWSTNQKIQDVRLRKMVTKNIGAWYYRLPLSDNRRNAMYGNVGGPQDLDCMGDYL